jgi:uncharacterized membrane protein YdjX (TVP38/TMEM64 family)
LNSHWSRPRTRSLVRAGVIILACVLVSLLLSVDSIYEGLRSLLADAEPLISAHPISGAVVFVLLAAASAILAFFSSALLVPAAVFTWGNTLTILLLWLGWLIGGIAMYWLGHSVRRPDTNSEHPGRFAAYLPKNPEAVGFPLVLLWQLALPSEIPGYLSGYLGVRFKTYLIALALGELPYAAGAVLLGESIVNRRISLLLALGLAFATIGYLLVRLLRRRVKHS